MLFNQTSHQESGWRNVKILMEQRRYAHVLEPRPLFCLPQAYSQDEMGKRIATHVFGNNNQSHSNVCQWFKYWLCRCHWSPSLWTSLVHIVKFRFCHQSPLTASATTVLHLRLLFGADQIGGGWEDKSKNIELKLGKHNIGWFTADSRPIEWVIW